MFASSTRETTTPIAANPTRTPTLSAKDSIARALERRREEKKGNVGKTAPPLPDAIRRILNPSANQYSSTPAHTISAEFTAPRGAEPDKTKYDSENLGDLKSQVQNFADQFTPEKQAYCAIGIQAPIVNVLTGETSSVGNGDAGRMTDTASILSTMARDSCDNYQSLVTGIVVINSAPLGELSGTEDDNPGTGGGSSDVGGSRKQTKTKLGFDFDEEGTPESYARLQSARKAILSAAATGAAADAIDANSTTTGTKSSVHNVVAGDLTSILPRGDIKVIESLEIYPHITPEGIAGENLSGHTAQEFAYLMTAHSIGVSGGFFNEDFTMDTLAGAVGNDPRSIYDTMVDIFCDHMSRLNEENIRLVENCQKNTSEWYALVEAYEAMRKCDVWVAAGCGRQVQAIFSMAKRIINYLYNKNPTPQIKKYLREQDVKNIASGSAAGIAFSVIEYMGGFVGSIDEAFNGKLNAVVLQSYIIENSVIDMLPDESATAFCDRVKETLYDQPITMSKNSANLDSVLDNLVASGTFDLVKTIIASVRSTSHMGHEARSVCANFALHRNNANMPTDQRSIETQLNDFYELRQEFQKVETRELLYNPPRSRRNKASKGRVAKGRSLREFAAAVAAGDNGEEHGVDEPAEEPAATEVENTGPMAKLEAKMTELTSLVASLEKNRSKGGGKSESTKTPAEKKAARLEGYKDIIENDFKQLFHDISVGYCEYCGGSGHKQKKCARFAYDLMHDQMNAHASDERIKYLTSHGYNNHKPAPGSFKVYPHGNGNGPAPKKTDKDIIADLEAQLKELSSKKGDKGTTDKFAALIEAITSELDSDEE